MSQKQPGTPVDRKHVLKIGLTVVVFFLIAVLGFLLTEPGFYKNPIHQIIVIKSDMDNYNRDVWFIAYPTIQGLEPARMLSLFHYALFPSPIEHTIPGAYPNSTFKLGWNNPQTNSSIPLTVFFFVGIWYMIQKIRKFKDCIPESLVLIWFVSTFFTTLMIARDLSLERYMLPFLISIIVIASYGFWSFTRQITSKKIQISFMACVIFAPCCHFHVILAKDLFFPWDILDQSIAIWNTPRIACKSIYADCKYHICNIFCIHDSNPV